MSEPVVQLFLDSFITGSLPKDGDRVTTEITLSGTDGTVIVVKQNGNTIYKEEPKRVIEAIPDKSVLFKFQFAKGTLTNPDSTTFTTPDNSIYTFSTGDGVQKRDDIYEKVVTEGTIQIKPPDERKSGTKQVAELVNNSVIQESSLGGGDTFGNMKDNPFYNILQVVFKVLMDMMIVVIFWLLFISISCWLKVPAEFLYPTEVDKFPYRYFRPTTTSQTKDQYLDYLTHHDEDMCKEYDEKEIGNARNTQKIWFDKIKAFETDKKEEAEILKMIYPEILTHDEKDMNVTSRLLNGMCAKSTLSIADCVSYLLNILRFYCFIYCTSVLASFHSFFATISNDILGKIVPLKFYGIHIISVLFAAFLYFLLLHSGYYSDQVIAMFGVEFEEAVDIQTIMINQFKTLIVNFMTCCLIVFVPLFFIMFIVAAGVTFYQLCVFLFDSFSGFVLLISVISLYFAMINYATLGLIVMGMLSVEDVMAGSGEMLAGLSALCSIFSVGIPLMTAVGYAGYISTKLVTSSFNLVGLGYISDMIKRCLSSIVMVALYLLIIRVNEVLGETYMMITVGIILLMGVILASDKGNSTPT